MRIEVQCVVMGCTEAALDAIQTRDGTYRQLEPDEIVLPPDFSAVCPYHIALYIRWLEQERAESAGLVDER